MIDPYYLTSKKYVPERLKQKIDMTTNSMMENGLHQFYKSFSTFLMDLIENRNFNQDNNDEDNIQALTMEQLKIPLIIFIVLLGLSSIVFVIEVIVYHFNRLRSRRLVNVHP